VTAVRFLELLRPGAELAAAATVDSLLVMAMIVRRSRRQACRILPSARGGKTSASHSDLRTPLNRLFCAPRLANAYLISRHSYSAVGREQLAISHRQSSIETRVVRGFGVLH